MIDKINKSAIKFLTPLSLEDTYRTITKEAVRLIGAYYGSILLEQPGGELKRVYSSLKLGYKSNNRKRANTFKSFKEQKVLVVPISEIGDHHPELKDVGIKWTIFIPLSYEKKSFGVITVNSTREDKIDEKELNGLKLFGKFATLAILNAQMYSKTVKELETRDLFISLASHELRNPLTSVNGYVQLLGKRDLSNEDRTKNIVISLAKETERLTKLINELLEINQIKTGTFNFEWSELILAEIIEHAIKSFKLNNPSRKVAYTNSIKGPALITGDAHKLVQVLINILQNAAKFSPQKSTITVVAKKIAKFYQIQIHDEGSGIDKKDLPHVFKDFYKGQNSVQSGMGLGLFLTKYIIDNHHGKIEIHSTKGIGTEVIVRLPQQGQYGVTEQNLSSSPNLTRVRTN